MLSAKFMDLFLFFRKSLEKIGIKEAANAPSDVILLKILGILNAKKKASAT